MSDVSTLMLNSNANKKNQGRPVLEHTLGLSVVWTELLICSSRSVILYCTHEDRTSSQASVAMPKTQATAFLR